MVQFGNNILRNISSAEDGYTMFLQNISTRCLKCFMIWCSTAGQVVLNTSKDNGAFIFTVQQPKNNNLATLIGLCNPEDEGTMILGNQWNQQHIIISQNTQVISNTTVRATDLRY